MVMQFLAHLPCALCEYAARRLPGEVLLDTEEVFAYLNPTTRSTGAVVLLPRRHIYTFLELSDREASALAWAAQELQGAVAAAYRPDGFHAWCSMGILAGQSQAHCHVQLVPRYRAVPYTFVRSDDLLLATPHERRRNAQEIRANLLRQDGAS